MERYTIGVDFGTLSARAVLVNVRSGETAAEREMAYPHGVITELPKGKPLWGGWPLQDPADYLAALEWMIPALLRDGGYPEVVGIGCDFTSCTILPVQKDGTPLCQLEAYRENPHAWVKLWKHHAAQPQAERLEALARKEAPGLMERYGGRVSAQWMLPKIWEILEDAPEIYQDAGMFLEAGDWIVLQLTGELRRNACAAGFKGFWDARQGYPAPEFLAKLDGRLEHLVRDKLPGETAAPWEKAGTLTPQWAARLGLQPGIAVAAGIIDAHAGVLGSGITGAGTMLLILGTSSCHILLSPEEKHVPGICGSCRDGILPGLYAYEAGQPCVGDMLDWFIRNNVPARYTAEAAARNIGLHQLLSEQAGRLRPGESGLLALDWWNGQRTPLVNNRLSGLMLGMTLRTTPPEQYRALVESTAYGTRWIVETFEHAGMETGELAACGGIAQKNPFLMQVYADVLQRPVSVPASGQCAALGAAILAASAAGVYPGPAEAAHHMAAKNGTVYQPDPAWREAYDQLYQEYKELSLWFAQGGNDVMKRLPDFAARLVR